MPQWKNSMWALFKPERLMPSPMAGSFTCVASKITIRHTTQHVFPSGCFPVKGKFLPFPDKGRDYGNGIEGI